MYQQDSPSPQTKKLQGNQVYRDYIAWLKQNGVLIHQKLEYPVVFEKGLVGVATKQKLDPNRAVIAVPYQLIIHTDKIRGTDTYGQIIRRNQSMFNKQDGALFLLCVYLMVEKLKGKQSFYYLYLEVVANKELGKWTRREVAEIQHPTLIESMNGYREELEETFVSLLRIVRTEDELFPKNVGNNQYRQLFEWAYEFVITRAFETTSSSISLVPFADALNHGQPSVARSMIDLEWWKSQGKFSYKRGRINLSLFNQPELRPTQQDLNVLKLEKASPRQQFIQRHPQILEGNKDKLSEEKAASRIGYLQYNTSHRYLRQLHLFSEYEDEAQEDSEEEINEGVYRRYLKKEKESLKSSKVDAKLLSNEYWGMYQCPTVIKHKRIPSQSSSDQSLSVKSTPSGKQESSESSDSDLQWLQQSVKSNVYFVMYTVTHHEKRSQLYFSYGSRDNSFLLSHYNFSVLDNPYDNCPFRMRIVNKIRKPEDLIIYKVPPAQKGVIVTRKIRVKKNRICMELVNHCRYLVSQAEPKTIILPFDKQTETKAIQLARSCVKYILERYSTTTDQDQELLQNSALGRRLYYAITIRLTHKHILRGQLKLLDRAQETLSRWKQGRLAVKQEQMSVLSSLREYLGNLQRSGM